MPDGNAPSRFNTDVDTKIEFNSLIKNDEATTLRIRDAFRRGLEGQEAGLEQFAQEQGGVKARIKLDFYSRQQRDEIVEHLSQHALKGTFLFASMQKSTIDCEISGHLNDVLDDMAKILKSSGSDIYIQPVGGSRHIQKIAQDDVMSAFSLWMAGRMSGQIAPHEM